MTRQGDYLMAMEGHFNKETYGDRQPAEGKNND
jgi:hypothetical protein